LFEPYITGERVKKIAEEAIAALKAAAPEGGEE